MPGASTCAAWPRTAPRREVAITSAFFLIPSRSADRDVRPRRDAAIRRLRWRSSPAALLFVRADLRLDRGAPLARLGRDALNAGRQVALIGSIIICASLVIGVLGVTGLGVKITSLILSVSGGLLWPALLLTALACLVLGMEVPTTAAYVICVSVAGPALIELGLAPLAGASFRVLVRASCPPSRRPSAARSSSPPA